MRTNKFSYVISLLGILFGSELATAQGKSVRQDQPNIILIMTDDLGYGDLGVFFQNQRKKKNDRSEPWEHTPNLDKLAASGAILTHNYSAAPVCAPSRASLLMGLSQGHANVRNNQFDKGIEDNYTLGNVLQGGGYRTAAIGKWGLQGLTDDWPAHPLNRGFDYYFGYIRHRDGHEHYPKEAPYGDPKEVYENRTEISDQLDKCYTGDLFTAAAKRWIVSQQQEEQPFFLFLAYDTPHAVLELPVQAYPAGGGLKGGIQWLGKPGKMINTAEGKIDSWVHPDYANATYDDDKDAKTPEVQWPDTYKRYATVVRRIDDQVGDLMKLLVDLKIDQQTMLVFTSDNGPSAESYLPKEYVTNHPDFFNSFGPFDGMKRDVWEGGLRVPTIISWPQHIKPGMVIKKPSVSYDFMPTFAEAAKITVPVRTDGVSLMPALSGKGEQVRGRVYTEYFESGHTPDYQEFAKQHRNRKRNEMQLLRLGDTVGVRYDIKSADDDFEFYVVDQDPQQSHNLDEKHQLKSLQQQFKASVLQMRLADTSAKRPYDDALIPGVNAHVLKEGVSWKGYRDSSDWIPLTAQLKPTGEGHIPRLDLQLINAERFDVIEFEGYLKVPADGSFRFELSTSGKAFLRLHQINLIDEDYGYQSGTTKSAVLRLKTGYHPFKLSYRAAKGGGNSMTPDRKVAQPDLKINMQHEFNKESSDLKFYRD